MAESPDYVRLLPPDRIASLAGFGQWGAQDAYVYRPATIDGMRAVFDLARSTGRKVVLRGNGRSYGDASILAEAIALDITRFDRILAWDPQTGVIEVEGGATIDKIWRYIVEDGYWLPVVSGTSFVTIAGALAMNVHGKNHLSAGTIAEHVMEIDLLAPEGRLLTLRPQDELFQLVPGSLGVLGAITRIVLRMKRMHSGNVKVASFTFESWAEQFELFQQFKEADYEVGWVDAFAHGAQSGRGQIAVGWNMEESGEIPASFSLRHQEVADTVLGFFPKAALWRLLRPLTNRTCMRRLNALRFRAMRILGNGKTEIQSLAAFNFMLDYVPNWRNAYLPGGLLQYQCIVPTEAAESVFRCQIRLMQKARCEPFLAVTKIHRADPFPLAYNVEGYSIAYDFKVYPERLPQLIETLHKMTELVLSAGGRFYLAKDSTLTAEQAKRFLSPEALKLLRGAKEQLDPERLLTSSLVERLELLK